MIDWAALKAANAPIGAFVEFDENARGGDGALAGLTIGIKANIMVRGMAWTGGMELYRRRLADRDAAVVARLRGAGAAILGTLNMHEAALGAHGDNPFYGTCHNPRRIGYSPGGSSSGSAAAVAAGLCDAALGTDTLGSIRIPAAYCGVWGLKPTFGAVSNDGLALLDPGFDCIGPLAASLGVLERVWRAIAPQACGRGDDTPFVRVLMPARLAGIATEQAVKAAFGAALGRIALPVHEIELPDTARSVRLAGLARAGQWLIGDLGPDWSEDNELLSPELRFILGACAKIEPAPEVIERTRGALVDAIGADAVLVMPAAPQVAFAHGTRAPSNQADFTALASVAGLPALAVPVGTDPAGLPIGIQLVGPAGSEDRLIALARSFENLPPT